MFKTKAEEDKEKKIREAIEVVYGACREITNSPLILKRDSLPIYFDPLLAKSEIKIRIKEVHALLEKEDEEKKMYKKVEAQLDTISSLYVSLSEFYLLVKDDSQMAKGALTSCVKVASLNTTQGDQDDNTQSLLLELRMKTCQNLIEGQLQARISNSEGILKTCVIGNINWILRKFKKCEASLLKTEKQCILLQLLSSVLQVHAVKPCAPQIKATIELMEQALAEDFSLNLADLCNPESNLKLVLTFRSEGLPSYNKLVILAAAVTGKLLREVTHSEGLEIPTLNNYNRCVATCVLFLKKFADGPVLIGFLQQLIEEVFEVLGIERAKQDLNESWQLDNFGKRELIVTAKRTREGEKEATKALNEEYDQYLSAASTSFLERYLVQKIPKEEKTRWKEFKPTPVSSRPESSQKFRKRHIHSSAESLIRCQTQKKLASMSTKRPEDESVKPTEGTETKEKK